MFFQSRTIRWDFFGINYPAWCISWPEKPTEYQHGMTPLSFLFLLCVMPSTWAEMSTYGLIRDTSIRNSIYWSDEDGSQLNATYCHQCLCHAFGKLSTVLFTCNRKEATQCLCHFYDVMPDLSDLVHPSEGIDIYLMQNKTFEERTDCCNSSYFTQRFNLFTLAIHETRALRSLVPGDNDTLVSVVSGSNDNERVLVKYNKSTLKPVYNSSINGLKTVGYYDGIYYLGTTSKEILIYHQDLTTFLGKISVGNEITTIRFLKGKKMLVGASTSGVYIYDRDSDGVFRNRTYNEPIFAESQVHAIGVLNETAFYVGVDKANSTVRLYVQQPNGTWQESVNDSISRDTGVFDLVVDTCQRLWIVEASTDKIFLDDRQNKTPNQFQIAAKTFNLVILDNYKLVVSHEIAGKGLTSSKFNVNCRQTRFKPMGWIKMKTLCHTIICKHKTHHTSLATRFFSAI